MKLKSRNWRGSDSYFNDAGDIFDIFGYIIYLAQVAHALPLVTSGESIEALVIHSERKVEWVIEKDFWE